MRARGLLSRFDDASLAQLESIRGPAAPTPDVVDLRDLPWCSIDRVEALGIDQLTFAQGADGGRIRVWVAIADVDALVGAATPIDEHARHNGLSVYTSGDVFPMLPEPLGTALTSLVPDEDRVAVVLDMLVDRGGRVGESQVSRGLVRSRQRFDYEGLSGWLEGGKGRPGESSVEESLRCQAEAARRLRALRRKVGALCLDRSAAVLRLSIGGVVTGDLAPRHRARAMMEDLMIAANAVVAAFLRARGECGLSRVVVAPARWSVIVEVAAALGACLPPQPDAAALAHFLDARRRIAPARHGDLSLTVLRLLGPGRYAVDDTAAFAVMREHVHATAPNRRFVDLVTQRLVKAALGGAPPPYPRADLASIAEHCTRREEDVREVERQVRKAAGIDLAKEDPGQ